MSIRFAAAALELAGGDVDDAVRQAELLHERLLDPDKPVELRPGLLRKRVGEHLDLVELVDAEHAARVAARGARLAPEVGREGRVLERQLLPLEDLAHVQPGQGHLGRASQVQALVRHLVDLEALGREEPGAVHRLLADEYRRDHRREALRHQALERPAVERE